MTVGPRASTERKEDQREVRGKMTLTVEYSGISFFLFKTLFEKIINFC